MTSSMDRVMGLAAGILVMGMALGAGVEAKPAPPARSPEVAAPERGTVRGVIKDVRQGRLALETAPAESGVRHMEVVLDDETVVMRGRKRLAVTELKAGDAVTVAWMQQDGRTLAKRIWLRTVPEAPKRSGAAQVE